MQDETELTESCCARSIYSFPALLNSAAQVKHLQHLLSAELYQVFVPLDTPRYIVFTLYHTISRHALFIQPFTVNAQRDPGFHASEHKTGRR